MYTAAVFAPTGDGHPAEAVALCAGLFRAAGAGNVVRSGTWVRAPRDKWAGIKVLGPPGAPGPSVKTKAGKGAKFSLRFKAKGGYLLAEACGTTWLVTNGEDEQEVAERLAIVLGWSRGPAVLAPREIPDPCPAGPQKMAAALLSGPGRKALALLQASPLALPVEVRLAYTSNPVHPMGPVARERRAYVAALGLDQSSARTRAALSHYYAAWGIKQGGGAPGSWQPGIHYLPLEAAPRASAGAGAPVPGGGQPGPALTPGALAAPSLLPDGGAGTATADPGAAPDPRRRGAPGPSPAHPGSPPEGGLTPRELELPGHGGRRGPDGPEGPRLRAGAGE
jgi:hypothetical protein